MQFGSSARSRGARFQRARSLESRHVWSLPLVNYEHLPALSNEYSRFSVCSVLSCSTSLP